MNISHLKKQSLQDVVKFCDLVIEKLNEGKNLFICHELKDQEEQITKDAAAYIKHKIQYELNKYDNLNTLKYTHTHFAALANPDKFSSNQAHYKCRFKLSLKSKGDTYSLRATQYRKAWLEELKQFALNRLITRYN